MKVNGTLVNYYFHCKRQCYLHGNRINLEDNSEIVKIGKSIHESKSEESKNTEISIDNIKLDKLTSEYLTEIKKSDADIEAAKWQLIFYLKVLKNKGILRKGKLECIEKNKSDKKVLYYDLNEDIEVELEKYIKEIETLLECDTIPDVLNKAKCKRCAYYEYCYI
ncbi:Dna2/Cas4 domain-containing protein [Romboutsia ilealis]|uniref:CRISPR-associated protein Cas4 n=1 Tax=Romboutsia faecis TaxID=2764597 RepID=A0ABR7JSR8_9FIRM|nr:CRISPR-associated protein Cas4 [Romboutsia faecis]MBC5997671.1 CRISPR-associated protein Cas4 [Romboutsia faecis]MRN25380.1 Dna2/Cas4 domain-containing protein [Romboutsia ilealis]